MLESSKYARKHLLSHHCSSAECYHQGQSLGCYVPSPEIRTDWHQKKGGRRDPRPPCLGPDLVIHCSSIGCSSLSAHSPPPIEHSTALRIVPLLLSISTAEMTDSLHIDLTLSHEASMDQPGKCPLPEVVTPENIPQDPASGMLNWLNTTILSVDAREQWEIDNVFNPDSSPHRLCNLGQITWPLWLSSFVGQEHS